MSHWRAPHIPDEHSYRVRGYICLMLTCVAFGILLFGLSMITEW